MDRTSRNLYRFSREFFGITRRIPPLKVVRTMSSPKYFPLNEAYQRNGDIDWLEVFKKIKLHHEGLLSAQDWTSYYQDIGISYEIIDGIGGIGGVFDSKTRLITLRITRDVFDRILRADEEDLKDLAKDFWVNFCHEDTHKQQTAKSKVNLNKNYKPPVSPYYNIDLEKDLDYYNRVTEADAYGREIAARLQFWYPNSSNSTIYEAIDEDKVVDEYCSNIINVYKDSRVSRKARTSFFRALYDYLEDNEEGLNESFEDEYDDYSDIMF